MSTSLWGNHLLPTQPLLSAQPSVVLQSNQGNFRVPPKAQDVFVHFGWGSGLSGRFEDSVGLKPTLISRTNYL